MKDRPVTKICTGRRIGLSHCVYWAKDRPFARSVLGERLDCHKVCTGEGSACHKVCIGQRIGLLQCLACQGLLGDGSACHIVCTGRRIGLSHGLYWANDRTVRKCVLGEGSACHKVCIGQRIGLLQCLACQGLLGEGSACHKDCWAKDRPVTKAQMYMTLCWIGYSVTSVRNCVRQLMDGKRFLQCGIKAEDSEVHTSDGERRKSSSEVSK